MKNTNNSNSEKSDVIKSAIKVITIIIIVIAAAIGVDAGLKAALPDGLGATKTVAEKKEPEFVKKINEATGEEEYYTKDGKFAYALVKEYSNAETQKVAREVYKDENGEAKKIVRYKDNSDDIDFVEEYENGKVSVHHEYENNKDTGKYTVYKYDKTGNLTSDIRYDENDKVITDTERIRNKDGNETEYRVTDSEGNVLEKTEYTYDKNGRQIKAVFYNKGKTTGRVEQKYDDSGRLSKFEEYDKNGKLLNYLAYEYDGKDRMVKSEKYNEDKELVEYSVYKYDKNGSRTETKYDAAGREIENADNN